MTTTVPCYMPYLGDPRRPCVLPIDHDGPHVTRGGHGWHDSDDMDGGVTAALIEKEAEPDEGAHIGPEGEVDWHGLYLSENRRAEQAEKERDSWESIAQQTAQSIDALRAEQPHPLTPDAITDEMVDRAQHKIHRRATRIPAETIRLALIAALTEPPARPEGAEDVAVRLFQAGAAVGVEMTAEQRDALADHLAAMRVRVVGEDGAA